MTETHKYDVEVDVHDEQGAKEAADRIARACSMIQEHQAVKSVRATIPGPNDFEDAEPPPEYRSSEENNNDG